MENPIKMDDLGVPLFLETYISLRVRSGGKGPATLRQLVVSPKGNTPEDEFMEPTNR